MDAKDIKHKKEDQSAHIQRLAALIRNKQWDQVKSLLSEQPDLLKPEIGARRLAARSEPHGETDDEKRYLSASERDFNRWLRATAPELEAKTYSQLFERCREVGVESALVEAGKAHPAIPNNPLARMRERLESKHLFDDYVEEFEDWQVRRALPDWRKLTNHPRFMDAPAPFRDQILTELGTLWRLRYNASGKIEHLRSAAEAFRRIVESSDQRSPFLAPALIHLANCLRQEFQHTGRLEDLDRAIETSREAAGETSDEESNAGVMGSLGAGLAMRYEMLGQIEDLNDAIRALELQRKFDQIRPPQNLALALINRSKLTKNKGDFDRAVEILEEAVHWDQTAQSYSNLCAALAERYERWGGRSDLERSIRASQKAVDAFPADSPLLGNCLGNLVRGLMLLAEFGGDSIKLTRAVSKCRALCRKRDAVDTIPAARAWAEVSARRRHWRSASEAYRIALDRVRTVYAAQGIVEHKAAWIRTANGLATEAAYAFSKIGDLEAALECFEVSRVRLIREVLALRPDVRWPKESSASVTNIAKAAASGPLVYIAACSQGGIALAVSNDAPVRIVWVPKLDTTNTWRNLQKYLAAYGRRGEQRILWQNAIRAMTRWLWRAAMDPLLEALGRPARLTLIRAGELVLLPLHAAWTKDRRQSTGRRYVVWSKISNALNRLGFR
jgi:tetratricopeptide (TPR) repeat protein